MEEKSKMKTKDEWLELYAIFKTIADSRFCGADVDPELYYPILAVMRYIGKDTKQIFTLEKSNVTISISDNSHYPVTIPIESFSVQARYLLGAIKSGAHGDGAFHCAGTSRDLAQFLGGAAVKTRSNRKSGIYIKIQDRTLEPALGFSIKSTLGGRSTLLNASPATKFRFSWTTKNKQAVLDFCGHFANGGKYARELLPPIEQVEFKEMKSSTFRNNLIMLDSHMDRLVAEVMKCHFFRKISAIAAIAQTLATENPLAYPIGNLLRLYTHKLKQLLVTIALGMQPSTHWNGSFSASGGYLVIKGDGKIRCYHFNKYDDFAELLFHNTFLETPSMTTRYPLSPEPTGQGCDFSLTLQIRYKG